MATTTVYDDPVTRRKPEGTVSLMECLHRRADGYQVWRVRFHDNGEIVTRVLHESQTR